MRAQACTRRRFLRAVGMPAVALAGLTRERANAATVARPTPLPTGATQIMAPFAGGFAVARQEQTGYASSYAYRFLYGWIDRSGNFAIPPRFQNAQDFSEVGLAPVQVDYKCGYIDTKGSIVIPPRY